MEKKIAKGITVFLLVFSLIGNGILQFLPEIQGAVQKRQTEEKEYGIRKSTRGYSEKKSVVQQIKNIPYIVKQAEEEQKETFDVNTQLRFALPQGVTADEVKIKQNSLAATIQVVFPKADATYIATMPVKGENKHIREMSYEVQKQQVVITIKMNQVMEWKMTENQYFFDLSFLTPKERYDKVVVIDPGHGGKNVGEKSGNIKEKDINLAIAQKLQVLLQKQNIGTYCTRSEDVNPTQQARAALAENAQADYFVSIHCNGMKNKKFYYITGTEVMYQDEKAFYGPSKALAQSCLSNLTKQCSMVNRGIQKGKDSELLEQTKVPAVLVRVGFLSNEEEKKKLTDSQYQQKVAQGLCDALIQNMK